MTGRKRIRAGATALCLSVLSSACGDSPSGPSQPSSTADPVTTLVVAGDGQVGVEDFLLPRSVAVGVLDRDGNPIARGGLPVTWEVVQGGGSVEHADVATNDAGRAFARWRTGTLGPQLLDVRVGDAEAARLTARAVDAPIVFQSDRDGGGLFRMTMDGSDVVHITSDASDHSPAWSPDRELIAFQRSDQVWVISANGADARAVTSFVPPTPAGGFAGEPSFTPDGERIVFAIKQGGSCDQADKNLYVISVDGTNQAQLTEGCGEGNSAPRWSPDGSRVAFQSKRDRGGASQTLSDIFVMNSDGSDPVNLTASMPDGALVRWAPDGSRLLFSRRMYEDDSLPRSVWSMVADGSSPELLHETDGSWAGGTAWDADGGNVLLTVSQDGSNADIFLLEVQTGSLTNLTNRPEGFDGFAAW